MTHHDIHHAALGIHERPIAHLPAAWREFAQMGGAGSDPGVTLLGCQADPGKWQPAFYVPSSRQLVIFMTRGQWATEHAARDAIAALVAWQVQAGHIQIAQEATA